MSTIINATTTNGVVIQPDNSGSLVLQTNSGTTALTIDTSQNVGIGTTSPAYKLDVNGSINISADSFYRIGAGTDRYIQYRTSNSDILYSFSSGNFYRQDITNSTHSWFTGNTERMQINSSGSLILAGSTAQKATGTTWSNPSDQRLKNNIRDYTKGTTELMQVRVREWEYNGNGGTTIGMKGLGVVADEVMTVLPNTVETYNAKLNTDDAETTAIKKFDATEITWLLVKTVQEQQTIINDLKARVEALEAK
jgi:hypothetical protein